MREVLFFEDVSFAYRRFFVRREVLDGFDWEVPRGRTVLLGPNGAGKSTLLGLAASVMAPRRGAVGYSRPGSGTVKGPELKKFVGWMPQHIPAMSGLTCREQVAYVGWLVGMNKTEAWDSAAHRLDDVGLAGASGQKATQLSGGQLRRLGVAQTLVGRPRLLLLDEPTAGLDPAQRRRFRTLIDDLAEQHKVDVLISTHEIDDLSHGYDGVAVLSGGELRFTGTVSEFLSHRSPTARGLRAAESAYAHFVDEDYL